jgi:hypothetical protein
MIYYKYDEENIFVEAVHEEYIERDEEGALILDNLTDVRPPDGLFKAKYINGEWVETGTPPEPGPLLPPTMEERVDAIEQAIIELAGEIYG